MRLVDLPTPSVLVDRPTLRANITSMQQAATDAGIRLRPHAKTHKSANIARWQLDTGAIGITVAKVGEAEVFADHGVADIRIAYPVAPSTVPRVLELMERTKLSILVDNASVAKCWSDEMETVQRRLDVLVKVDVGFHRCGINPKSPETIAFVTSIASLPGLRLRGLLSHAGQSYNAQSEDEVERIAREESILLNQLADGARAAGARIDEISVGSTPTARFSLRENAVTELRPGNYVFFDLTQVALGTACIEQCALNVWSTVVSRPTADRLILDAGSKTLSSDHARGPNANPGFGAIRNMSAATGIDHSLVLERLSEEHAVVSIREGKTDLVPGDRVRLIPNHACVVVNLTDTIHLVENDEVVDALSVHARGKNN